MGVAPQQAFWAS